MSTPVNIAPLVPDLPYHVNFTEKVRSLEDDLNFELSELQLEVEENEMIHGIKRPISSIMIPKDVAFYRKEREHILRKGLEVLQSKPLGVQADAFQEEMDSTNLSDYSPNSIALILHQHFIDRLQELVLSKYLHLLRWKRFCEHTKTIEAIYPDYQKRMQSIMFEYNDCLVRSKRLAAAREAYNAGVIETSKMSVQTDDMFIYLRWLICHFNAYKMCDYYLKILHYLPIKYKREFNEQEERDPEHEDDVLNAPPKNADNLHTQAPYTSNDDVTADNRVPSAPPFNTVLISTNPLPTSDLEYAAAASGGGIASNFHGDTFPVYTIELDDFRTQLCYLCRIYGLTENVKIMTKNTEEMELYASVSRVFRNVFYRQEEQKTFKTYDRVDGPYEDWGADSSDHALLQESNWVPFINITPDINHEIANAMVKLRERQVDPLLKYCSLFIKISSHDKIVEAFKKLSLEIGRPFTAKAINVLSHETPHKVESLFKRIYGVFVNHMLYQEGTDAEKKPQDFDEDNVESVDLTHSSRNKDDYDFQETIQILGLEDDPGSEAIPQQQVAGAYLSYTQLRHIRIRDLMRSCLSILNYFRSVERTITINDQGLSMLANGKYRRASKQETRASSMDSGTTAGTGNLGSHQYMHNTPVDFKLYEMEFMEYSELENHDDFYKIEDGRLHVQDQRGYYIVYDTAMNDLKQLEEDLLLIGSEFIEKDREMRKDSATEANTAEEMVKRGKDSNDCANSESAMSSEEVDINSLAHSEVDRMGVLQDLWTQQLLYLECKKELLDVYFECYQHVFDRNERRNLAQKIVDTMGAEPQIDFNAPYFISCFRGEAMALRLQTVLLKKILNSQIEQQRQFIDEVAVDDDTVYGLPYKFPTKQLISVNLSRSSLMNVFMLEFHPTLCIASRIGTALSYAAKELFHSLKPMSITNRVMLRKAVMHWALDEWEQMPPMGSCFSNHVRNQVFFDKVSENPNILVEIVKADLSKREQETSRMTAKERQELILGTICRAMQIVTLRHRLISLVCETQTASLIYRTLGMMMDYPESHMFMRMVQMDFAEINPRPVKFPPILMTDLVEEEYQIDKYVPVHLGLAVTELDDTHIGKFTFRTREGIIETLTESGMENMKMIVMCQIVQRNILVASIQLGSACLPKTVDPDIKNKQERAARLGQAKLAKFLAPTNTVVGTLANFATWKKQVPSKAKAAAATVGSAFVSIQLEKQPYRDMMLNAYGTKKRAMGPAGRKTAEIEKLKRKMMTEFCQNFNQRAKMYSMRSQIVIYYSSILALLDDYPSIRDHYFVIGTHNEKVQVDKHGKAIKEIIPSSPLEPNPRTLQKRIKSVMSPDGKVFHNLWYIPHQIEILKMFKHLEDGPCFKALHLMVQIVGCFHDLIQYMVAYSKLGYTHAKRENVELKSADWGGQDALGSQLHELQRMMDNSPNMNDPEIIAHILTTQRELRFLVFDVVVRYTLKELFLANENPQAFQALNIGACFPLRDMSNCNQPNLNAFGLNVPEPLEPHYEDAKKLYPYRSLLNRQGPYFSSFQMWSTIEDNLRTCFCLLKDRDRPMANGELMGTWLLLDEMLEQGIPRKEGEHPLIDDPEGHFGSRSSLNDSMSVSRADVAEAPPSSMSTHRRSLVGIATKDQFRPKRESRLKSLSRIKDPIESTTAMKHFLIQWKRLEVFKMHYLQIKFGKSMLSSAVYPDYVMEYFSDILLPTMQLLARKANHANLYDNVISHHEVLATPPGITELEVKTKQIMKLLELTESTMIMDVRKKITKEHNLAVTERSREENALPTDLWKRSSMREGYTINRPTIIEEFATKLKQVLRETERSNKHNKPSSTKVSKTSASAHDEDVHASGLKPDKSELVIENNERAISPAAHDAGLLTVEDAVDQANSSTHHAHKKSMNTGVHQSGRHSKQPPKKTYTIGEEDINSLLNWLGTEIMQRERYNFDSYSMFYENLLKVNHQNLFNKEQDVKSLTAQLQSRIDSEEVEVQSRLADSTKSLLMEICALRAKIHDMSIVIKHQSEKEHKKAQAEFDALVQNLFAVCFDIRREYDVFREKLYNDVRVKISETRNEALLNLSSIKDKFGVENDGVIEKTFDHQEFATRMLEVQQENTRLVTQMTKLRALHLWKQNYLRMKYNKSVNVLFNKTERARHDFKNIKQAGEEEVILLRHIVLNQRSALRKLENEAQDIRKTLNRELKEKKIREHIMQQQASNARQLDEARRANFDKVFNELTDKQMKLNMVSEDLSTTQERVVKLQGKLRRDSHVMKKQLGHERMLKLDAFSRVDELTASLFEKETELKDTQRYPQNGDPMLRATTAPVITGGDIPKHGWPGNHRNLVPPRDLFERYPAIWKQEKPRITRPKTNKYYTN